MVRVSLPSFRVLLAAAAACVLVGLAVTAVVRTASAASELPGQGVPAEASLSAASRDASRAEWPSALSMLVASQARTAGPPPPCQPGVPSNQTPPSISGNTDYGSTLTTTQGSWTVTCGNLSYSDQWLDNGSPIGGATSSTYTSTQSEAGHTITSEVTACNTGDLGLCSTAQSSNSITVTGTPPNDPPATPSEDQVPASGSTLDGKAGDSFTYKYSDPNGDNGYITYTIRDSNNNPVANSPLQGPTVASGADSSVFLPSSLSTGTYSWTAVATDIHGAPSGPSTTHYFAVDEDPNQPQTSTPATTGMLATLAPTLTATGSDPEGDSLGYQFTVSEASDCSNPVWTSDWQPGTPTATVPSNVLQDDKTYYWCVQTRDFVVRSEGDDRSPLSASSWFKVALPKLGVRSYWPIWHGGNLDVNEATGNLVLTVPGPSFPTAAGTLGASFTYNMLDSRSSLFSVGAGAWSFSDGAGAPTELIDHSLLTGANDQFDSVERVEADGSSDWYGHIAGSDAYQSQPGDLSVLTRSTTQGETDFLLSEPNGTSYQFGPLDNGTGVAPLEQAEVFSANGQARLVYLFDSGKPSSITATGQDGSQQWQTLAELDFDWACPGALLCVTGPDGKQWQYIGQNGSSGDLVTVNDDTRDVLQIGYDANGLPNSIRNADDLDPADSSLGYLSNHAITIGYDSNPVQVASISDTVRSRYQTPDTIDREWTFAYHGGACPNATEQTPQATHSFQRLELDGCTEITSPDQYGLQSPQPARVFYDHWGHPLEIDSPLETVSTDQDFTLYAYDKSNQLQWTEDGAGNRPTTAIRQLHS